MKIKISESKIRQIVNEEVLKKSLIKTLKEQKYPSYTAYLVAEILKLEWQQKLLQEGKGKHDDGDGTDEKCDYVDCEDDEKNESIQRPSPEWIAETADAFGLTEAEIAEATEIMNNQELEEGIGGFLKAVAKPYQNMWQTFTNITQNAANMTDPDAKKAAAPIAQAAEKIPEPKELVQQAKENPEDLQALIRQLIDLLSKTDQASDLDDIKPGLEQGTDQALDAIEQGAEATLDDVAAGGEEEAGGGKEAFVFKGKGGKGLQSFLARGSQKAKKLKGPAMGAVLKHIAKQLKSQGVTVNEGVLDEIQGWMWYGLVEGVLQEHYGQPITIQEILNELGGRKGRQSRMKQDMIRQKADARRAELAAEKGGGEAAQEEPAAAEEPAPETVKPTVQNTAPDDAPLVKVFKGKGGEGLQSALARSRDKLGIDQQTVSVIIKSVEAWAQANQIRVENITEDTFDSIINEIVPKFRARKLQETINKLKNV